MSGLDKMKCCKLVFSLLKEQTHFSIVDGPGFVFKDDGMYITAKDDDGKLLMVKLFKRRFSKSRGFSAVLSGNQYFYINDMLSDVLGEAASKCWNVEKTENILRNTLADFFAANHKQFK